MAIIELDHLTKRFDDIVAVDDLTLNIANGEFFGLLGPNGAGKSTTLLILTTLVRPTSGTARVNGFDVVRQAGQVRRSIGIVFQDPSSDDTLTGYENLKLHGMLYGMPPGLRERRIGEVLELVDLTNRKDDIVKHYSGGMRRRLELARGLMHSPRVLFLDEPTRSASPISFGALQSRSSALPLLRSVPYMMWRTTLPRSRRMGASSSACIARAQRGPLDPEAPIFRSAIVMRANRCSSLVAWGLARGSWSVMPARRRNPGRARATAPGEA
jgi:ABC-type nitrate/sulfonate/bicarbonate transport system ATPase subunit